MADEIPALADLTPGWLTELLRGCGHDVTIAGVAAKPIGTGQVGATYRLALSYEGERAGAPASLVAKLPSNDPLSRATGKSHLTYLRESRFYQQFAGKKPMAVPRHLFIAFDNESHDFALVMHDLPRHSSGNQLATPTLAEARLAMEAAASIHAAWWGDPMLDTLDWLNGTKAVPPPLDVDALYTMFWPTFCDRYGMRVSGEMKDVGEAFVGKVRALLEQRGGARCLTHNDFRPDNMLFARDDPDQSIVIVDWQTCGVGQGTGDIAYYAGTAFDPDTRRREERGLVDHYREKLVGLGVHESDLATLWDDYRAAAFGGFLMGVTAAMVVEQTERGDAMFLAMAERAAAMVLDHRDVAMV